MRLKAFVVAVAALAIAMTALASQYAATTPPVAGGPLLVVALGALVFCAEYFQISFYHRGHTVALNLIGTFATTLAIGAPGPVVPLVMGLAVLASNVQRRNAAIKTVFNTAQWMLWGASSVLLLRALPHDRATLLATIALLAVFIELANASLMCGLLTVLRTTAADIRRLLVGMTVSGAVAVGSAVCLTAAYIASEWTLILGLAVILGMHAFGRATASLRADHQRLEALQNATHHLATSIDRHSAIPDFLAAARSGFEVSCIDLLLTGGGRPELFRCRRDETEPAHRHESEAGTAPESHPLLDALRLREATEPLHINLRKAEPDVRDALQQLGHSRVLAVPLRSGGRSVGALLLFDRYGVEGFEEGETAIVSALARELVGFLDRCALTAAIDEERHKLADIIDGTGDGIFTLAADGTVTSWNAGFAAMTGYTADEMIGTRHFGLLRPRDTAGRDLRLEQWLQGTDETATAELQVLTADGVTAWLSCSYSRLPSADGGDTLVVVARNVTQARELERLKDDFVAVVSHELRTPLVPIRGWAQTLLNRGDRLSDEQRRGAVQSILSQSQKLESLVLNILEASRIEAGQAELHDDVDLAVVCARVVDDTVAARPERTIRFLPPAVPSMVRGSQVWAERAIANLVANAVKYSPDDEPVDVALVADGEAKEVRVTVTDRGPGIPPESQERIFARFERLEETRKQTGTGLGLYITRRMARAMGGDVTVTSVPGAGSTFVLCLPLLTAADPADLPRQRALRTAVSSR